MLLINKNNFFCEEMIEKFEFIEYNPQYYHNKGLLPQEEILPRK